jgi:serine/threonine-protein kinase RsbW
MQQVPDPGIGASDLHLVFPADPVSVRENLAHMLAMPPLAGLLPEDRSMAELVLAEVLNNVAEHAYANARGRVAVTLAAVSGGVSCLIVDQGIAMPGGRLPDGQLPAKPAAALDDLPEGGFGWHLIRVLTRDLSYVRRAGSNRLSFTLATGGQSQ